MAATFVTGGLMSLNISAKTLALSQNPSAKTLSLSRPSFRHLSLSTTAKTRHLPVALSLSDPSYRHKNWKWSWSEPPEVDWMRDNFDITEKLRNEEYMKYSKLYDELEDGVVSEAQFKQRLKDLQYFYYDILYKRATAGNFAHQMDEMLYWFERQTMILKEIAVKFRKDHEMIAQKMLLAKDEEDKAVLVGKLKYMFYYLSDKQAKGIWAWAHRTAKEEVMAGYITKKPFAKWQWNDYSVEVNQLLDWFEKDTMDTTTEKLRREYEIIVEKRLLARDDEENGVLVEKELEEMFSNLSEKKEKAIRDMAANKAHDVLGKRKMNWQANDFSVVVKQLMDWFDALYMDSNETDQKLRKKFEMMAEKLLVEEAADEEAEDKYALLKDLQEMYDNLMDTTENAMLAMENAGKSWSDYASG